MGRGQPGRPPRAYDRVERRRIRGLTALSEQDHSADGDQDQAPTRSFSDFLEELFDELFFPAFLVLFVVAFAGFAAAGVGISHALGLGQDAWPLVVLGFIVVPVVALTGILTVKERRVAQRARACAEALTKAHEAAVAIQAASTSADEARARMQLRAALRLAGTLGATAPMELPDASLGLIVVAWGTLTRTLLTSGERLTGRQNGRRDLGSWGS